MQPDVSFIVAAYNASATIGGALDSALAQTGVTLEVIVADDASSDGTAAFVQRIGDERIQVCRLETNKGPGGARNVALAKARGRYAAVLDADDTLLPGRMERLVGRLDESGAAAAVDGIEVRTADGALHPMYADGELGARRQLGFADYVRGNRLFASTYNFGYLKPVFRREFLDRHAIRYPERLRIGEDYQFLAELLVRGGDCVVVPEVGYRYGITAGSVSRVLSLQHVRSMAEADVAFRAAHPLDGDADQAYREREASLARAISFLSMVDALKKKDASTFLKTAARDPMALRHFSMPIAKRVRTLRDTVRPRHGTPSAVADAPSASRAGNAKP